MEPDVFIELEIGVRRVMPLIYSKRHDNGNTINPTNSNGFNLDDLSFAVTPIDANHCPGSVCYLFEGYFGRFLCTGDFRYRKGLFDGHNVIDVDRLYLDDTYCAPKFNRFLTTSQCAMEMSRIVKLEENLNCRFMIAVDTLGKENVFIALSQLLDTLIVVNPDRYKRLEELLENENMARYFTTNVDDGYIFMVNKREISLRNLDRLNEKLYRFSQRTQCTPLQSQSVNTHFQCTQFVGILPSGWSIGKNPKKTSDSGSRLYTVTYSAHSSFDELCDAVHYIKPRSIIPIVADKFSFAPKCFKQYLSNEKPRYFAIPPLIQQILNGKRNMATIAVQHLSKNHQVITRRVGNGKRKMVSSLFHGARKRVKGFKFQSVPSSKQSKVPVVSHQVDPTQIESDNEDEDGDQDIDIIPKGTNPMTAVTPKRKTRSDDDGDDIIDLLTPPSIRLIPRCASNQKDIDQIPDSADSNMLNMTIAKMEDDANFVGADIMTQDIDLVLTPFDVFDDDDDDDLKNGVNGRNGTESMDQKKEESDQIPDDNLSVISVVNDGGSVAHCNLSLLSCSASSTLSKSRKRKRDSLSRSILLDFEVDSKEHSVDVEAEVITLSPGSMFKPRTKRKRRLTPVDTQINDTIDIGDIIEITNVDEWGYDEEEEMDKMGAMDQKVRSALMSAKKRKKRRIISLNATMDGILDYSGIEASQMLDDIPTLSMREDANLLDFVATLSGTDGEDSDFEDENLLNGVCSQMYDDAVKDNEKRNDCDDAEEEDSDEFTTQRSQKGRLRKHTKEPGIIDLT